MKYINVHKCHIDPWKLGPSLSLKNDFFFFFFLKNWLLTAQGEKILSLKISIQQLWVNNSENIVVWYVSNRIVFKTYKSNSVDTSYLCSNPHSPAPKTVQCTSLTKRRGSPLQRRIWLAPIQRTRRPQEVGFSHPGGNMASSVLKLPRPQNRP